MARDEHDVIIVGAGHNGLVTANYLAAAGLSVLVLERLPRVGGAIATEELFPGFRSPYCAYICHMLHGQVIEDLELRRHGFALYHLDPFNFHPFPDGTHLLTWNDQKRNYREIERYSESDARAYIEWCAFWDRACGIIYRYLLSDPPTFAQVAADVRGTPDEDIWEIMLTISMRDLVDEYFEDPHVRAHFIGAQDAGDPSAPGSVMSLAYIKSGSLGERQNRGIPKGGMGSVSASMAKSAAAKGVKIRLGAAVARVIVENRQAVGVTLSSGEEIRSRVVVSNADPKRTYLNLVPREDLDETFLRRVRNLKTRANCVKLHVALKELPDFSRFLGPGFDPRYVVSTNICPSVDYFQASWDSCKNGEITRTPLMEVQIPSVYDDSLAPFGQHIMSCWTLYYPSQLKNGRWDADTKCEVAEILMEMLSQYAPNFHKCVLDYLVETPLDIETRIGMTDGNIRHLDVISQQMFSRRMPYRSAIEGLYLCGAGTHPGGELSGANGHNCARAILRDFERAAASNEGPA